MKRKLKAMINLKVRIKNKAFWVALIPALALVVQEVTKLFGVNLGIDVFHISDQLLNVVNAVFAVLAIVGVAVDTTTQGFSDTEKTLKAKTPHINAKQMKK